MMNGRPTRNPREPRRGLRRRLSRVLGSKVFLLLASVFVAVLFWGTLVASDGTLTRQKTFPSVAVSVTGEAALQSKGFIVMDDVTELVPSVKMTVEVTQANYDRVTGTSYNPHFDLSQITAEGENELTISYTSQLYGPVIACEPSSVTVNVERYMTRRVPVVLETYGQTPEGVYLSASRTDPTMLSVSGPQSVVSTVTRAVAKLDLSQLSAQRMDDRTALLVELQNAAGEAVVSDKVQITNQTVITDIVVAETELVPAKWAPLDLAAFVEGEPAEGYELTGVTAEEEQILVAAGESVLDALDVLTTDQPLDIGGATGNVTGYVRLRRLSGLANTLPTEVSITALIEEKTAERTFRSMNVEIDGLDESAYRATLSSSRITAQLTGGYHFIHGLSSDDVRLYIDVSGLDEGKHSVPVQVHIDNAQAFDCALSSPELTVTIKEK